MSTHHRSARTIRRCAALTAVVLVVAACGDSDDSLLSTPADVGVESADTTGDATSTTGDDALEPESGASDGAPAPSLEEEATRPDEPEPLDDATNDDARESDRDTEHDGGAAEAEPSVDTSTSLEAPGPPECAPGAASQYASPAPGDDEVIETNQIVSGEIEEFTSDVWRLDLCEGQVIFLDSLLQCSGDDSLSWRLLVPDGDRFFRLNPLINLIGNCGGDTGPIEIDETGTWSIEVFYSGYNESEGEYKFEVLNVPEPDRFDITVDQEVRIGDPGSGAGVIEFPGSIDEYRIDLVEGQRVFFDAGDSCEGGDSLGWRLVVPDGDRFFRLNPLINLIGNCAGDTDPIEIDETGTYTVQVSFPADTDRTASEYSFTVVDASGA